MKDRALGDFVVVAIFNNQKSRLILSNMDNFHRTLNITLCIYNVI